MNERRRDKSRGGTGRESEKREGMRVESVEEIGEKKPVIVLLQVTPIPAHDL